jgi:predicted molibdopterin-dependent oxidoreductase YjgC
MFRRRPDATPAATVTVTVEGRDIRVPEGASAAAAVLLAGLASIRETGISGAPRAPYCLMGICFDCLAKIDGVPNRQSCMVAVAPGMIIRRQHGKRSVDPSPRERGEGADGRSPEAGEGPPPQ